MRDVAAECFANAIRHTPLRGCKSCRMSAPRGPNSLVFSHRRAAHRAHFRPTRPKGRVFLHRGVGVESAARVAPADYPSRRGRESRDRTRSPVCREPERKRATQGATRRLSACLRGTGRDLRFDRSCLRCLLRGHKLANVRQMRQGPGSSRHRGLYLQNPVCTGLRLVLAPRT